MRHIPPFRENVFSYFSLFLLNFLFPYFISDIFFYSVKEKKSDYSDALWICLNLLSRSVFLKVTWNSTGIYYKQNFKIRMKTCKLKEIHRLRIFSFYFVENVCAADSVRPTYLLNYDYYENIDFLWNPFATL